jgi:hypothetical protein
MQINKSDRNDAAGIARIMQTGWFKEVRVKDLDSHSVRALLASRALLVKDQARSREPDPWPAQERRSRDRPAKFNVFAAGPKVHDRAGYRPDHRALLQGDDRRSDPLQAIKKCWGLCRIDDPTSCFGGDRLDGTHLEVW